MRFFRSEILAFTLTLPTGRRSRVGYEAAWKDARVELPMDEPFAIEDVLRSGRGSEWEQGGTEDNQGLSTILR